MTTGDKIRALTILVIAEIFGMALWFTSSAVITDMAREAVISPLREAMMASGVQLGFALGAVGYAILGLADRFDPRRVFAVSALMAALANALLLIAPLGGNEAISIRMITGALLAGVYPVGMKIAVGWGTRDRGLLVGLLVGALTLGSAAPHLLSFLGGADWRLAVGMASALAAMGGVVIMFAELGPYHARAPALDLKTITLAWTDQRIRLAYAGYLGHMWELYAFWAWISVALSLSFRMQMGEVAAASLAKLVAFSVIAVGAIGCVLAGILADRVGKAETTILAMAVSGAAALLTAVCFGSAPAVVIALVVIWGFSVIADSAQFSALVADFAPPEATGALLTFQTSLGFALTIITVQGAPVLAKAFGWPAVFVILALGPITGIVLMMRLRHITSREGN